MKLKNKKTGEVATLTLSSNGEDLIIMGNDMLAHITKLSELNDYEDYEEPKEYWYIDYDGGILCGEADNSSAEKMMKSIGNYFGTLSEAEKAVEKLKAWKRLKDKGFINEQVFSMNLNWWEPDVDDWKAFHLLFGGEE